VTGPGGRFDPDPPGARTSWDTYLSRTMGGGQRAGTSDAHVVGSVAIHSPCVNGQSPYGKNLTCGVLGYRASMLERR